MSKSLGNVLDPFAVLEEYGTDALRFYLMRDVSFGADGAVGIDSFTARYESELANEYGNLASRTLAMIRRYRDGVIPVVDADPSLAAEFDGLADDVTDLIDAAEVSDALDLIWRRVRRANRYVEEQAPWQLAKDEDSAAELDRVLASLAEAVRVISILLSPYMPASTQKLLDALSAPDARLEAATFGALGNGARTVTELPPLFPKRPTAVS
jgi:methionyl-tRNA synthetase